MSNSLKELVLDLFINNTNYQVEDICYSKQIHAGYTNTSFLFQTTDNNKFQIRIGNTNNSERKNELNALEIYDSKPIFFDVSNGNLVKKWINGDVISKSKLKRNNIVLICKKINELHQIGMNQDFLLKHDYLQFVNLPNLKISRFVLAKYKKLVNAYKDLPCIFSHNDLSPDNILFEKENKWVTFIDLEWARLNNEYFDYANFVRENKLSHFTAKMICKRVAKLKWSIFKNFLFITTCYAYQWTFSMPETTKMIIYRLKTKHLMEYYYYLYCFAKKIKKPK